MENTVKKSGTRDLTIGHPLKAIILFTIPLLLGNLFQQFYNLADSIVVGNFIGDEAMGAIASSNHLINLLIGLIQGVSVGAGIVIAQFFGAKNYDRMSKTIHTTVAFGLVFGFLLSILGYFISPLLLKAMNTPENILPESTTYFKTYFIGVIFTLMYNCGSSIFRAIGDSRIPLYFLMIACVANIILDLLFVGVFHFGIASVAVATIIAQGIACFLTFFKLIKEKTIYQLQIKKIRFHRKELIKILAYGIPTGIQNSIISFSNVFVQTNINSFGEIATEGCGIYTRIEGFATMPSGSFSMALSTYVGQNIGAKKYDRVKKGGIQGIICSMVITQFFGLMLYILVPYLALMFTNTEQVIAMTILEARTITPFYFLIAFSHAISGVLRGAGYNKTPMIIMIVFWVAVRIIGIPIALNISGLGQIQTIFWFYPLTWCLSSIVLIILNFFLKWYKPKEILY